MVRNKSLEIDKTRLSTQFLGFQLIIYFFFTPFTIVFSASSLMKLDKLYFKKK